MADNKTTKFDLHGNAPDSHEFAVLLIDLINDFDFSSGDLLLSQAMEIIKPLTKLLEHARRVAIPVIYVNDNFGKWRSSFEHQLMHSSAPQARGSEFVKHFVPHENDYYILKPKHSAFYASPLDLILRCIGVNTLVLCGLTADNCVMFTASDAYLRDYKIVIPRDCVASIRGADKEAALQRMEKLFKAKVISSEEVIRAIFQ